MRNSLHVSFGISEQRVEIYYSFILYVKKSTLQLQKNKKHNVASSLLMLNRIQAPALLK